MSESRPSTSSLITPFVPRTLSPSMKRTLSNKIENLIEITHHLDGNTELPLLCPYSYYHRTNTFSSSIRSLIRTRRPDVKEVVQSTRLEQCTLPATAQEQYSTIEIGQYLIDKWKSEGYTHLHFGAIRLVLTLHGRKGLPVTTKVALLDSTYKKYSDSLIGALLTTLSNGSVILTIQPDYNVSLFDRTLLASKSRSRSQEQNKILKPSWLLSTTRLADDTSIIQIPRQIPKEELAQIMPMEWISNYERLFHSTQTDVHTTTPPTTQDLGNGITKTIFSRPSTPGPRPPLGRLLMLRPAYTPFKKSPPIAWVDKDAKPYFVSHVNGHFLWDVPGSGMCDPHCECDTPEWWEEDCSDDEQGLYPSKYAFEKTKKNKSSHRSHCRSHRSRKFEDDDDYSPQIPVSSRRSTRRWQPPPPPKKSSKDMSLAELMLETGHHDLVQKYFPNATPSTPPEPYSQPPVITPQPVPCIAMMNSYEHDFPPLERKYDHTTRVPSKPYVTPNTVDAQGYMGSQFKQKELELQAIQQDLKKIELDMAKKKSQAIYEPYPSYPSFQTIPAPLFPSSPTSYPEATDYSKQFKFNYPLFAQLSPPKLPPQTRP
ncbi:hypothetical protein K1719_005425 [Acacia pycnantha]|nr:hypothetical protein K1719_005425 [Acacia pycnantha]